MRRIKLPQYRTEERIKKVKSVLEKRQSDITVVLENINDPHNMSACLRSCDAVGIMKVYLLYHGSQKMPQLNSSSSASAKKWVETNVFHSVKDCFEDLRAQDFKIFTTKLGEKSVSIYDLDLTQKVALVFGNEHAGVSEEATNLADGNFLVPQVGMIQSLNISVACAVSVYEAFRQRNAKNLYKQSKLSEEELTTKLNNWLEI